MDFISIPAIIQIGPFALWFLVVAFLGGAATFGLRKARGLEKKVDEAVDGNAAVQETLEKQAVDLKRSGRISLRWTIATFVAGAVITLLVTLLVRPVYG